MIHSSLFYFLTETHCISVGKALQAKQLDILALVQLVKGEIMASYRTFSQHAYNKPVVIRGEAEMQVAQYHCSNLLPLALSRQKPGTLSIQQTPDEGPL